jgi:hypothetical protein
MCRIKAKPRLYLDLRGPDGNAYVIMGAAVTLLRRAGYSEDELKQYKSEAMSGDYRNLLEVTGKWTNFTYSDSDEDEESV